ncbi:ACT domain-containing protein ACR1 [Cajanus cajan]|uniref:ACT domain-containing protein ACR n=1 Tax=Cajanus cajan TaxID=3821 RepID=A0A151SEA6_CAJCA|nr:ACT domain-containing protein ACR1 [Cajanus cajan]KYP53113.1 [Protein-PII] uridylyltransferase [Cajanus cajan]
MDIIYQPRINREIESLRERIHPPRVCIDNDSYRDCTVVKIDSANRHGILLEMVQALTDLDLVISKSYISSDGGWLMDVFHVTDQVGKKLTDKSLVHYVHQALCEARSSQEISSDTIELQNASESVMNLAIELTTADKPGLFSEISAVLLRLGFNVTYATAWTHNERVVCIIHLEDAAKLGPIDSERLAHVREQLQNVVEARDGEEEGKRVRLRLRSFGAGRNHTDRRLHQMMYADGDYESCGACHGEKKNVSVGRYEEKGYWVVNVRSRDRPKLFFDTVCVLTDMKYEVFHAAVASNTSMADQEYFVRPKGGSNLDNESEKQKLIQCLIAAIERRVSHGLKVDIRTENRRGLLSRVTRVIRENGLSITKVQIGVEGETAVGSFYVADSSGQDVNPNIAELVRRETGGSVVANYNSPYTVPRPLSSGKTMHETKSTTQVTPRFSLGSMLWSQLECLSNNFRPIRS